MCDRELAYGMFFDQFGFPLFWNILLFSIALVIKWAITNPGHLPPIRSDLLGRLPGESPLIESMQLTYIRFCYVEQASGKHFSCQDKCLFTKVCINRLSNSSLSSFPISPNTIFTDLNSDPNTWLKLKPRPNVISKCKTDSKYISLTK